MSAANQLCALPATSRLVGADCGGVPVVRSEGTGDRISTHGNPTVQLDSAVCWPPLALRESGAFYAEVV